MEGNIALSVCSTKEAEDEAAGVQLELRAAIVGNLEAREAEAATPFEAAVGSATTFCCAAPMLSGVRGSLRALRSSCHSERRRTNKVRHPTSKIGRIRMPISLWA